jgi:predicted amidohydrolase YtcJ
MLPLFLALMTSAAPPPPPVTADLLLVGGKIWAGKGLPRAEALAVRDGRVLAIGRTAELLPLKGPATRVIELHGQFVIPGFNDAHLHFLGGGQELLTVDLRKTRTLAEFLLKFGEYLAGVPEGRWVTRGRWDHEVWDTKTLPTRWDLDKVSPKNPVLLPRVDGHMVVANSEALRMAGVTRSTTDPAGGTIDRRADGEPTGILRDTAIELVRRVIPAPSDDENLAAARAALKEAARFGITSVQDNSNADALKAYLELKRRGELTARISYWRDLPGLADLEKAQIPGGLGDEWVRFDAISHRVDARAL